MTRCVPCVEKRLRQLLQESKMKNRAQHAQIQKLKQQLSAALEDK